MAGGILKFRKLVLGILFVLMLIVTIKSASAANLSLGFTARYSFDTNNSTNPGGNPTMTEWFKLYNVTSSVNTPTWNQAGKNNEAWDYEWSNSEYSFINTDTAYSFNTRTMSVWVNLDNGCPDAAYCFMYFGDDNETRWSFGIKANEIPVCWFQSSGSNGYVEGVTALNSGQWYLVNCVYNISAAAGTEMQIYINGSLDNSDDDHNSPRNKLSGTNTFAGQTSGSVIRFFDGLMDEFLFHDRPLSPAEINLLWAGGNGNFTWFNPGGGPVVNDTLNLSNRSRPIYEQYNVNPSGPVWATANATYNWTCRLYLNGTLNQTKQYPNGTNVNCSFNINLTNGGWSYFIRGNTSNVDENTTNSTLFFDNINPIITIINWTNQTIRYNQNITGQWNITDNFYLHRLNATIDGVQVFGVMDINATQYTFNFSSNVSGLAPGNHILNITVADGHTAKEIPEYDWSNGLFNDYLRYDMVDGYVKIEPIDGSIFDSFKTIKLKDRYTFSYEPSDVKKAQYQFKVTSDLPLHYAYHPHMEWLILGNHWLDFELLNENEQLDIKLLNKYEALITVSNINNPEKLEFSSIGDLNIVSRIYNFTTTNMTLVYSSTVNELTFQTSTLNISKLGVVINTTANFTWNGTVYNVSRTTNANWDYYNITFLTPSISSAILNTNIIWYYTVIGPVNNITGLLNNTQKVIQIGIDNCSNFTTRAVNISLRDEENNSLIIGDIRGYFNVWVSALSAFKAFNLTWTGNSTYGICINNNTAVYQTNAQMEYWATNYDIKNYYLYNNTLDNITDILTLYLTRNTTQVTLRVSDYDDDVIPDVLIHIQSYDLGTNSYLTTEIVQTDFQGRAFAEMILFTQWYQFMLVYQGNTILQTDATKLTSTTLSFQVDLGSNPLTSYNQVESMICAVSFNNATNNFRFDFNNPSGTPILATLDVYNSTTYITNLINTSSITSASGTILLNIGTPKNETYTGKGFVTINGVKYSCGNPESVEFGSDHIVWGLEGIFYTFLLIVFFICVGIWSPAIAVLLLIIAVIVSNIFGMFHLNTPYLISFIIMGGITLYRLARTRI